jgi:predicted DNA-binding transcriptional regulator AlpA
MSGADIRSAPNVAFIKPAKRYLYKGQWLSVLELSQLTGIPRPTIYARLRRGQPFDVAGKSGREPRRYLFRGKMMSAPEIAQLIGMDKSTVYDRVCGNRVLEGDELHNPHFTREQPAHAHLITYAGKSLNLCQWARELDIPLPTLRSRLRLGWSMERIVNEPVMHPSIRGTILRNRKTIAYLTMTFRRARNQQLIQKITNVFHSHTPGYLQTFTDSQGTGVGRSARHLDQEISL